MPAVEWSSVARADLLAIVDYISDDNPDAAQRLKDDIETKAAQLPAHPALSYPRTPDILIARSCASEKTIAKIGHIFV